LFVGFTSASALTDDSTPSALRPSVAEHFIYIVDCVQQFIVDEDLAKKVDVLPDTLSKFKLTWGRIYLAPAKLQGSEGFLAYWKISRTRESGTADHELGIKFFKTPEETSGSSEVSRFELPTSLDFNAYVTFDNQDGKPKFKKAEFERSPSDN